MKAKIIDYKKSENHYVLNAEFTLNTLYELSKEVKSKKKSKDFLKGYQLAFDHFITILCSNALSQDKMQLFDKTLNFSYLVEGKIFKSSEAKNVRKRKSKKVRKGKK